MNSVRAGQPGATRLCPHCKATVLESATICPGCRHHLRFNGGKELAAEAYTSFSVDGTIAHRQQDEACEYCVVLQVTNERGEQILRQIVGVGALQPGEKRRLNVTVDMLPLVAAALPRPAAAASPAASSATTREAPRPALAPRGTGAVGSPPATRTTPAAKTAPATPTAPVSSASLSVGKNTPSGARASVAPGAAASPARAAVPAAMPEKSSPVPTPAPSAPRSLEAATKSSPAPGAAPEAGPGATLGQRLRIFRKP